MRFIEFSCRALPLRRWTPGTSGRLCGTDSPTVATVYPRPVLTTLNAWVERPDELREQSRSGETASGIRTSPVIFNVTAAQLHVPSGSPFPAHLDVGRALGTEIRIWRRRAESGAIQLEDDGI